MLNSRSGNGSVPFHVQSNRSPLSSCSEGGRPPESLLDRCLLKGDSPVDLSRLSFLDRDRARDFIKDYGYDLQDADDRRDVDSLLGDGLSFLKRVLCPAPHPGELSLQLPEALERPEEPSDLLVWASRSPRVEPLQGWACALLRVIHAISQANHFLRSPFHDKVKEQILGRYRRHLHRDGCGQLYLGQGERLPLVGVHFREEKKRDSLILKLLHKPDNLPQGVYDRIGVRMITPTKGSALRVLKYLRANHLVNWAHVTPGRSRNTLLSIQGGLETEANPFSCGEFRSIQFTCQHLVKVANPILALAPEVLVTLRDLPQERYLRFFFPYEVQIVDCVNHVKNEEGNSSHANYRLRQIRAVRVRVFKDFFVPSYRFTISITRASARAASRRSRR